MQTYISTWYISVLAAILFIVQGFVTSLKLKSVSKQIGSTIKSSQDLALIKTAINLNMLMSLIGLIELVLYMGLLGYLVATSVISLSAAAAHSMLFALACFASVPYFKKTENDFASTFETWLKQWKQRRLKLPD
jgi:hypothetical protein